MEVTEKMVIGLLIDKYSICEVLEETIEQLKYRARETASEDGGDNAWQWTANALQKVVDGYEEQLDAYEKAHESYDNEDDSYCCKCGQHMFAHNDDGSCVED
jgi:hypothetical protein